jgi:hypothetical protein
MNALPLISDDLLDRVLGDHSNPNSPWNDPDSYPDEEFEDWDEGDDDE